VVVAVQLWATAALEALLQSLARLRLLRHTARAVVEVVKTLRAVPVKPGVSSLSGPLNAEGDLSRLPVMWGHA
jgi:hypothetical protein